MKAVISGDIVAYTSLNDAGRKVIEEELQILISELEERFDTYGRIIKGDYLECVVPDPQHALHVALAIKSFVKSVNIDDSFSYKIDRRIKLFKTHGIRVAIGYGPLSRFDSNEGIIDGEAIYLSGRKISEFSTYKKKRILIKNTLYFVSNNKKLNNHLEPLMALLDVLISKGTSKQCKVLYMKLMNNNEVSISDKLKISQSVVNQHSTSIGWNAINMAVKYFSEVIKNS